VVVTNINESISAVLMSSLFRIVSNDWVTGGGESILWLPPDYRATRVAIWNGIVVLGHSSGGISFLEFEQGVKDRIVKKSG